MIHLKFKVTETKVTLTEQSEDITRGNVNQINCTFELDSAFENLIVRAVFNNEARYVANNKCIAPEFKDYKVIVGVYGYRSSGDNMEKVISPEPCTLFTKNGSYNHCIIESAEPTPTELERYYELINAELKNKQDKIDINFLFDGEGNRFLSDNGEYKKIEQQEFITDYNQLANQPIVELEVEEGTNIGDFHIGLWKIKNDVRITDSENSQVYLCAGDIVKIYGVMADGIEFTSAYSIMSDGWSAVGGIDDPVAQSLIINKNDLLTLTDDTLNEQSDFPVSNKAVTTELNSLKIKIERPSQFYFSPKTNTEYRFGTIYSPVAELEMNNGFAFGSDFISGLVFVSGETPTEFTYSKNIKFTGDDCNDNVFVPTADKIYDIVLWSNDCGLQAVVRGVDR